MLFRSQHTARKKQAKPFPTSAPDPAPAAELFVDSELSGSECPSPEQLIHSEVSECFRMVGDMQHPLPESMVHVVVDSLSGMQRPLSDSEVEQLSDAFGVKTREGFHKFVSGRFPAGCRFLKFIDSQIKQSRCLQTLSDSRKREDHSAGEVANEQSKCQAAEATAALVSSRLEEQEREESHLQASLSEQSSDEGRRAGEKWKRVELIHTDENAMKAAQQHYEQKQSRCTKDFEQAFKNTQTEKFRQDKLTSICAVSGMPPDALGWLAGSRAWYTLNPNDFSNSFWQQLEEAEKKMHAEIQKALSCVHLLREQPSTPGERKEVLSMLSDALLYKQKNMLSAFASDTKWGNIKTGGEACEFKLACDKLLAQCKKKQEQAREDFHKAMLRRDEIVQIRLKVLHHLVSAATKYSTPGMLDRLAYTDIFDTYDPAGPNDVFTQILKELRVYGESTVGAFFIGK